MGPRVGQAGWVLRGCVGRWHFCSSLSPVPALADPSGHLLSRPQQDPPSSTLPAAPDHDSPGEPSLAQQVSERGPCPAAPASCWSSRSQTPPDLLHQKPCGGASTLGVPPPTQEWGCRSGPGQVSEGPAGAAVGSQQQKHGGGFLGAPRGLGTGLVLVSLPGGETNGRCMFPCRRGVETQGGGGGQHLPEGDPAGPIPSSWGRRPGRQGAGPCVCSIC